MCGCVDGGAFLYVFRWGGRDGWECVEEWRIGGDKRGEQRGEEKRRLEDKGGEEKQKKQIVAQTCNNGFSPFAFAFLRPVLLRLLPKLLPSPPYLTSPCIFFPRS